MTDTNPIMRTLDTPAVNRFVSIIGRLGICFLFCTAALFHLTFGRAITLAEMRNRGLPFPEELNALAMIVSGGLALALLFNFRTRWAALGLALYTLIVSSVIYTPGVGLPAEDMIFFMKDMAIFGALLAWSCSLADRASSAD